MFRHINLLFLTLLLAMSPAAFSETSYQKPPKSVLDVLHAPLPPDARVSPTRERMILATPMGSETWVEAVWEDRR